MKNNKKLTKTKQIKFCKKCSALKFMLRDERYGYCPICSTKLYDFDAYGGKLGVKGKC